MAPKKDDKKDAKAAVVQEGPTEEEKELIEKELLIAYLKSKVGRCGIGMQRSPWPAQRSRCISMRFVYTFHPVGGPHDKGAEGKCIMHTWRNAPAMHPQRLR